MPASPDEGPLTLRVVDAIAKVESDFATFEGLEDAPSSSYAWLHALETAGCVKPDRGWLPHHLALCRGEKVIALAPAYLKGNSEGEFVFDYAWANAAQRAGIEYYPKLLLAVPFTPTTGPRVLVAKGTERDLAIAGVAEGLARIVEHAEISSAHVLFPGATEASSFEAAGLLHRLGVQYQWHNQGYSTFEDFLTTLPTKKRTQIRRERRAPAEQGLTIETLTGKDLVPEIVDAMFDFYIATVDKFYWGRRYMNRAFFETVASTMGDAIEFVVARDGKKKPVAGAFNLRGKNVLFGRYWGSRVDFPFLHFNVCYYHSVERCIAEKLTRFEPGAGGEHKAVRGFAPTITHSVHHVADRRFRRAILDFTQRERAAIEDEISSEEPA